MSYRVVQAVLDSGPPDPVEKLLLVSIAENANDAGWGFPGIERLARRCCRGSRQTIRLLNKLEANGWIAIKKHAAGAGKKQTAYQVDLTRFAFISHDVAMSDDVAVSCDISTPSHVTFEPLSCDISPSPILRNHRTIEPSVAVERVLDFGEEFQQAPPAKPTLVTIPPARKKAAEPTPLTDSEVEAIRLAYPGSKKKPLLERKRIRIAHGLLTKGKAGLLANGLALQRLTSGDALAFLLSAAKAVAQSPDLPEQRYITHLSTWLNEGGYLAVDMPETSAGSKTLTANEKLAQQRRSA